MVALVDQREIEATWPAETWAWKGALPSVWQSGVHVDRFYDNRERMVGEAADIPKSATAARSMRYILIACRPIRSCIIPCRLANSNAF